jgi:hypothetical protein
MFLFVCFVYVLMNFLLQRAECNRVYVQYSQQLNQEWKCNDYLDKLWLRIEFDSSSSSNKTFEKTNRSAQSYFLMYNYVPCDHHTDQHDSSCQTFKKILQFSRGSLSVDSNKQFVLVLDTYFAYKFKIIPSGRSGIHNESVASETMKSNASTHEQTEFESDLCVPSLEFTKFDHCDQYALHINEATSKCELKLVKQTPNNIIKYFYIFLFVLFISSVCVKLFQVVFNKYKVIK